MLSVSLRQLEYVVAVAEQGGVSSAAAVVSVSQPSLSVAIARLEEDLGKSLFIRRKGGPFVPTAFGRDFIEQARDLLADAERLVDPEAKPSEQRRPVAIGFFEDLAPLMLAPILRHLKRKHPNVLIATRVGGFERLAEDLCTGQLDCAVTYDLGLDQTIGRMQLATLSPHALASKSHSIAAKKSITLATLTHESLILADQGHSVRHIIDLFRQRGLTPRIVHRAASLETMRSLVGNDFGIGITYTLPAARCSYDGKPLVSIRITDKATEEPIVLATNSLNEPTPLTCKVTKTIAKMAQLSSCLSLSTDTC